MFIPFALRRCLLLVMLLMLAVPSAGREPAASAMRPGQSYFGEREYVEYLCGNLPVILSAPHGGRERPLDIPDREKGTFAFDTNTQELARAVAEELHERTGGWPHLVLCRVHRRKVDCNREIVEAAAGNAAAEQVWHDFQEFLKSSRQSVEKSHGRGLYIDLHGHGHMAQRLELGYLHGVDRLAVDDAALNGAEYAAESSLQAIVALGRTPYSELLRGKYSLGALLEAGGFPCSPSPTNPRPAAPYFRGGYNTVEHGREAAPLAGLQIETNSRGVRDTAENRQRFAKALAGALETFLSVHMGVGLVVKPERPAEAVPAGQTAAEKAKTLVPAGK